MQRGSTLLYVYRRGQPLQNVSRSRLPHRTAQRALYHLSAAVLRTHEEKRVEGGVIASLSVPWGFSKGDDDLGGYHLIWPRDLVETATTFVAIGARHEARRVLRYLRVTQEPDGHWTQNMWLDGTPYWLGIQMDETALPILLVDLAAARRVLDATERDAFWTMVRRAGRFLWEWSRQPARSVGGRPWLCAVHHRRRDRRAPRRRRSGRAVEETIAAAYLRETADAWNASIERWLYVAGTELAQQHGVDGYYVRVAEPDQADAASPRDGFVPIKYRPPDQSSARGLLDRQPRRAGLRALRTARSR